MTALTTKLNGPIWEYGLRWIFGDDISAMIWCPWCFPSYYRIGTSAVNVPTLCGCCCCRRVKP